MPRDNMNWEHIWLSTSLEVFLNIVFLLDIPVNQWCYDSELQPLGEKRGDNSTLNLESFERLSVFCNSYFRYYLCHFLPLQWFDVTYISTYNAFKWSQENEEKEKIIAKKKCTSLEVCCILDTAFSSSQPRERNTLWKIFKKAIAREKYSWSRDWY